MEEFGGVFALDAAEDTKGVSINVKIDGDDKKVQTDADGTTRVNLPGIHITANDRDDTANVRVGPITVDANDGAATIRMRRDVRLRGEALSRDRRGLRATDPGVVHPSINAAEFVDGRLGQRLHLRPVRHVASHGDGFRTFGGEPLGDLL